MRWCIKRDLCRREDRCAHIHADAFVRQHIQLNNARQGLHADALFVGKSLLTHKTRKTTRAIAALLHFTAIGIEDAVAKINIRLLWRFDDQHLIAADTETAIRNKSHLLRCEVAALGDEIEHDKIVAEPVHFAEFEQHGRC